MMRLTQATALRQAQRPAMLDHRMTYRKVMIDGLRIAYREAGPPGAPTLLLLHGVPSSSRMYDRLMRRLRDSFHVVALDYPGFGNSAAPDPVRFDYSFDHLAQLVARFTDALDLHSFTLFMQDYGAPVGMRLAMARPQAIEGLIFQNGNIYEEGLGAMWARRRALWLDPATHVVDVMQQHMSLAVTRGRHLGDDPDAEAYDPDLWADEWAFLQRPRQMEIQLSLIMDYRHNVDAYPRWQAWLRHHQPRTLVLWGRHDLAFTVAGADAFARDLPEAEIHLLDAGHFAMDTRLGEVAGLTRCFLSRLHGVGAEGRVGQC